MSEPTTTTGPATGTPAGTDPASATTGQPAGDGGTGEPGTGPADGQPDPNSPDTLRERLRRRQEVIDRQAEELRTWRDLGITPDEARQVLAARQQPAAGTPAAPPVDEAAVRQRIEAEVRAAAGQEILRAQLLAEAKGKLINPDDALVHVDLSRIPTGDKGALDRGDLADALDELLITRPYLAVPAAPAAVEPAGFAGAANGGARTPAAPKSLQQRIADAEAAGDVSTSMALKAQLAFEGARTTV